MMEYNGSRAPHRASTDLHPTGPAWHAMLPHGRPRANRAKLTGYRRQQRAGSRSLAPQCSAHARPASANVRRCAVCVERLWPVLPQRAKKLRLANRILRRVARRVVFVPRRSGH
eukprot:1070209-Prymnesium_polylepis.1